MDGHVGPAMVDGGDLVQGGRVEGGVGDNEKLRKKEKEMVGSGGPNAGGQKKAVPNDPVPSPRALAPVRPRRCVVCAQ